jgi:hypothetical protein
MKLKFTFMFKFGPLQRRAARTLTVGVAAALGLASTNASAQDRPYFVTYSHDLEEPGALEIAVSPVFARQRGAGDFLAGWTELEYGVKGWWTSALYLSGQGTRHDSALFTGVRWENRFRPLMHEHRINPVLYVELERINGADKIMRGIVGHDGEVGHAEPNAIARDEIKKEIETKLILSSNVRGWNLSENLIAEKNFAEEDWEFGYAMGLSRPLALAARPDDCTLCPENFSAGVELYGGLGTHREFGLRGTSHYLGLLLGWDLPSGMGLKISPAFGLNDHSHRFLLRWGMSYEFAGFGRGLRRALRGRH